METVRQEENGRKNVTRSGIKSQFSGPAQVIAYHFKWKGPVVIWMIRFPARQVKTKERAILIHNKDFLGKT